MPSLLACIDGSAYSIAVCDYAAWFADRLEAEIILLTVEDVLAKPPGRTILEEARQRLEDHGAPPCRSRLESGDFLERLAEASPVPDLIVLGKRGTDWDRELGSVGANVEAVLRRIDRPVCLVSQIFLPISSATVLLDGFVDHRRTVEFVLSSPILQDLELSLVLVDGDRAGAQDKLAWTREVLRDRRTEVYTIAARNFDEAVESHFKERGSDLLVMSREALFGEGGSPLGGQPRDGLWRMRTPILVC